MGNKNIKRETKKPKKSDKKVPVTPVSTTPRPTVTQPELIKKAPKTK